MAKQVYPRKFFIFWLKTHFLESVLLSILLVGLLIYIFFLKTSSSKSIVYIEASIQSATPQTNDPISSNVLDGLGTGDKNAEGTAEITNVTLFQEKRQTWQLSNSINYISKEKLMVDATQ